jgi:hypothetical protein
MKVPTPNRRNFCHNAWLLASIAPLDLQVILEAIAPQDARAGREEYLIVNGWVLTASDANARSRTDDVF